MARKIQLAVVTAILTTAYLAISTGYGLGREDGYGFQNLIVSNSGQTMSISFHYFI